MKGILYIIVGSIFASAILWGQSAVTSQKPEERIIVDLRGSGFTPREIEMIIKGEDEYLPAVESFTYFGIKSQFDSLQQHVTGFFRKADSTYQIHFEKNQATIRGKTIALTDRDFLFRNAKVYLNLNFF